jgi:hypothetical protein
MNESVSAEEVARIIGMPVNYVYKNAKALGGYRLGGGKVWCFPNRQKVWFLNSLKYYKDEGEKENKL